MISKIELDPTSMNEAMMTCLYFETIIQVFNYSTFNISPRFFRQNVRAHTLGEILKLLGCLDPLQPGAFEHQRVDRHQQRRTGHRERSNLRA